MNAAAPALSGRLVPRESLTPAQVAQMRALLDGHFEGVTPEGFDEDLRQKNWAVLLEDAQGAIRGFSTLHHYRSRGVSVIFSGDTIVDRACWGSPVLPRTWIRSVNRLRLRWPEDPLYWLLISSGFRTYRFLPLFWKSFYPRYDQPTAPDGQRLLDRLAAERFGPAYSPLEGLVKLPRPQSLRGELASVPEGKSVDPHVEFFLRRNPGYLQGDELACLTEVSAANLTAAGRRMWGAELHDVA